MDKFYIFAFFAFFALQGCSSTDNATENSRVAQSANAAQKNKTNKKIGGRDGVAVEQWSNFDDKDFNTPITDDKISRVVFVRDAEYRKGKAINIYVNKEYQASLLAKGATSVDLCKGEIILLASHTNVSNRYLDKLTKGQVYNVKSKEISYFRLEKGARDNPVFRKMTRDEYESMEVDKQRHTLSRVDKYRECLPKTVTNAAFQQTKASTTD